MSVLSAQTIRLYATEGNSLVTPFCPRTVSNGKTFGLGPAGYDIRAAEDVYLYAGDFRLGSSIEYFNIPDDILAYVKDKSSWARMGVCVQNTVLEPGWKGFLTLEYTNHGRQGIQILSGEPIAQIIFHRLDMPTEQPYKGKYQNQQRGVQEAIHESISKT